MPFLSTYCLTGVSLTLDLDYLFMAAPAECSRCSLPWMSGISSRLPLLTLDVGSLLTAARCSSAGQEAGKVVWYSHPFKNFPQFVVIYTVKGFCVVNKPEADIFLELSCFLSDPTNDGNLISDSSSTLKPSLFIWRFLVLILLEPSFQDFEHNLTNM